CKNDYEWLSNKCFNNNCIFNDENLIVHCCDSIYRRTSIISIRGSYIHCGKPYGDSCKTNNEGSSKKCKDKYFCYIQNEGPSDSESVCMYLIGPLIILIILIIICWCCCYKKYSYNYLK
ncbi:hypothetical protein H8356DRAFT_950223, partial [Neocallimastix lanati (nom. inval.)]